MKICYILGGFTSGGIGRVVSILANYQIRQKNEIYIITLFPAQKHEIYYLDSSIKRDYLIDEPQSVRKVLIKAATKLKNYLKNNEIDILIACGNVFFPIALLASKIRKTRVICWEHSNIYNVSDNMGQTQLRWLACKLADMVVVLTDCDKNGYEKKYRAKKITRIYNPIDPELYKTKIKRKSDSKCRIISVGRFGYQKHFEMIPEIAKELKKYTNQWEWHIFGDGETIEDVKDMVREYALEDRIIFEGQVENIYERYSEFDIMVMTSRYEGFPMTLLEGCANGIPLISFNVLTGPDEIIEDGVNGFLIKEGDIAECALKIAELINNPQIRLKMKKQSPYIADKFKIENIVNQWSVLFKKI